MATCLVLVASAATAGPAAAQADIARADAWLRAGNLARAEALYYAAARRRPRDPEARFALGSYLASRGATRVGSVLIEEARQFGGDPVRAATLLAPLYARSGNHAALLRLEGVNIPRGEMARARWLRDNPESVASPDSVRLPLLPPRDPQSLGAILVIVGSDTVRAEIDPGISGLLVDATHLRTPGVRTFDAGPEGTRPAAATVRLGLLALRSTPLRLGEAGGTGRGRVGLDWLGRRAGTIDLHARTVTLRRSGTVPRQLRALATARIPILLSIPGSAGQPLSGPWTLDGGAFSRLAAPALMHPRPRTITYDLRRGELLIAR